MAYNLPPLNWLRAFEAAARKVSFTAAAEELNLTAAAVSYQVRSLEEHLGFPLFDRLPRSLRLTEMGRAYLPAVRKA
ncbi:MAG: LysR family transcriptional regulator, partial [Alphaproteobacteria bacterium]|nr:LysR family transcriptional regulator [Alphaproteobacteria bacterium]